MTNRYRILLIAVLIPLRIFGQVPNTFTDAEKVYGLSKIWKEIEYNYAYFEKTGTEKWDSLYLSIIKLVQETKNDYEYYKELERFIAFLQDGHTRLGRFPNVDRWTTVYKDYLIEFDRIEDKVIVTRINLKKKDEIPLGSELIEVNGITTEKHLAKYVIPYIAASTDHVRNSLAAQYIFDGLKYMEYNIKLRTPENEIKTLKLIHDWNKEDKFPPEVYPPYKSREEVQFKWFDDQIGYLVINSFKDSSIVLAFKEKLPELYKAKTLIIDIRENSGGNTEIGLEIFKYLTNDKYIYCHKSRSRKHFSHNKANGARLSAEDTINAAWKKEAFLDYHNKLYTDFDYEPYLNDLNAKRIIIPTIILIGHNTVSAAEDFLVPVKNQDHIKTIGELTNGSTGTLYKFTLPGGGTGYTCTLQSYYPDGSEFVGVGIKPDIEVKRTINGIINIKDEALDKALKYLREK
ncbi:MAG: hypothetical protein KAT68_12290 [Bacteroidales bacterium]|nr:hypothetical protein [Bacteroidales bacterium]